MAELEKLSDDSLDAISGGIKYNIGAAPVDVLDAPGGRLIARLYPGDFLVTDGSRAMANGIWWHHVYFSRGDGYVNAAVLGL